MSLLKWIRNKRAITNMKCSGDESFRWSVMRALDPKGKNAGRADKELKRQIYRFDWISIIV